MERCNCSVELSLEACTCPAPSEAATEQYDTIDGDDKPLNCALNLAKEELPILLTSTFILNTIALVILFKIWHKNRTSKEWKARNYINHLLVTTLALNDWSTTTIFLFTWIGSIATCSKFGGDIGCGVTGFLATSSTIWSAYLIIIMCAVRYLYMVHPISSRTWVTSSNVKISILCSFVYVLFHSIWPVFKLSPEFRFYRGNKVCAYNFAPGEGGTFHRAVIGVMGGEGVACVLIVLFFNINIIVSLKKTRKVRAITQVATISRAVTGASTTDQPKVSSSQNKKVAFSRVVKFVSAVYVLCYGPFSARMIVDVINNNLSEEDGTMHGITLGLLFLSPLLNPIIYLACNKSYRQCLLSMVKGLVRIRQGGTEVTASL